MLSKKKRNKLSGFMSKILRHTPYEFNLDLDNEGYCDIQDLLLAIHTQEYWKDTRIEDILLVVKECEKQRYEIKDNKIRARYGHSFRHIKYKKGIPPDIIYHGTSINSLEDILNEGIKKMDREYVHLSEDIHFASLAGKRHGDLILLKVNTKKAMEEKIDFYIAGKGVWLAEFIPNTVIEVLKD